ncbi:MAG: hypothetical protein N2652_07890 [Kiritimatiellae bacterium]|nr:hypothetical protein [Kiritimatiellia bacterium]
MQRPVQAPRLMILLFAIAAPLARAERQVIALDGVWEVAEGTLATPPSRYDHTVPVPGLLDMADPPFQQPGSTVSLADRTNPRLRPADPRREAFWYRRLFTLERPLPPTARLRIRKACYGIAVWLNGAAVGEHDRNFTPAEFDVRPHLRENGTTNELVIRVGASLAQVPPHRCDGWDNEKSRYIPGIYDSVELILAGEPYIRNIQVAPLPRYGAARVRVELDRPWAGTATVQIVEWQSRAPAGEGRLVYLGGLLGDDEVPIRNPKTWSPESPFLYEAVVTAGTDVARARFGLRSFRTDPPTGRVLLNDRPYYLRGSNVTIFRFFEDAERRELPWNRDWVRRLHRAFKDMHWNALRYCIGFPPDFWYEIADEEGILIQDEFPIWYIRADTWPSAITGERLAEEYREWMRHRWNHPCVVIWDAQNETPNDSAILQAIAMVRGLDLSDRPWENGWGIAPRPGDIVERHPYRSNRPDFQWEEFGRHSGIPGVPFPEPGRALRPPYLINEYGWLWINRDGSLPTLTTAVYERLLGPNATVDQRREYYARALAAKTEFWRARRQCAGVLHFCGLGYSRPDGQTSDHWLDVRNLVWEPLFYRYVRDAFAPVGVMLDWWATTIATNAQFHVPLVVVNDLDSHWVGEVRVEIRRDGNLIRTARATVTVPALETATVSFPYLRAPASPGPLELVAVLSPGVGGGEVRSIRQTRVVAAPPPTSP